MATANIFSKDLQRSQTSSETYHQPKPLINFVKDVWRKSIDFADRLVNLASSLTPKNKSESHKSLTKRLTENQQTSKDLQVPIKQEKSDHQIQESIRKKYQPIPCWRDANPHSISFVSNNYRNPKAEKQTIDFFQKNIASKIHIKKTVILASPGNKGYMNVDKFLQRLKEIKAEKKTRLQLKISREQFEKIEDIPLKPEVNSKSLAEIFNPNYKQEKKPTAGEERQKLRKDFFDKKMSTVKKVVRGQMTEEGSSSEDQSGEKVNAPVVQREADNQTIFQSSREDSIESDSQPISQTSQSSKQAHAQNITEATSKEQALNVPLTQPQKPKPQSIQILTKHKHSEKPAQPVQPVQPLKAPIQHQLTPKYNPFLSALPNHSQNGSGTSQHQIKSTMEEMKKKLFGTSSNNTLQPFYSGNSFAQNLPNFGGSHNSFSQNLSVSNAPKPLHSNGPVLFSAQSAQQGLTSFQPSYSQAGSIPTSSLPPQNYQQLQSKSVPPQLPFINNTQHPFMNQKSVIASPFHSNKYDTAPHSFQVQHNQTKLPSFLTAQNKTPSFMTPPVQIPQKNQFANPSSSPIFSTPSLNMFSQKPSLPFVQPSLLNEEKNKTFMNGFTAPSHKGSSLFQAKLISEEEEEWDRRTQRRTRENKESRRREKKQDRVRY